jgi:hypothetical protein
VLAKYPATGWFMRELQIITDTPPYSAINDSSVAVNGEPV